jgi:anti-repressor protein
LAGLLTAVTIVHPTENRYKVDDRGRAIAKYDGIGITYLARRFGFGGNTKACRHWLETIGVSESQWLTEPSLIKAQKLPREILPWLDHQYASRQGTRQGLLGE